jgi:thioesterase domain-containing protein/acyl carrier protein
MVPSTFFLLPELPTTRNGKVDYRALPVPDERTRRAGDAPPRDELESKLDAAWKEVLGLETLSMDDNFFEVGGQSLATITLTTLLRRKYRIDIPVAELFRHQTIRSLSDAIRSGTLERENLALLLNVRGAKPPLFFLPPATGVGHCFMGLSTALPHDRPHYAFMTPGQETGDQLPSSIESLAARYLDYIARHHGLLPQWYLAGYSVGGVVAYEMGRQCLAKGYPPPHLLMLDSYLPWHKPLIPLSPAQILYDVYGADASRYLTTAKHLVKLFFEYKPRPAQLGVTLFKAMGSNPLIYGNRRKWQRYALGGFEVIPIPGSHRTLLDQKNVLALAQGFEGCLAANDQKWR